MCMDVSATTQAFFTMAELVLDLEWSTPVRIVLQKFAAHYSPEGNGSPVRKTTSEIYDLLQEHSGLESLTTAVLFEFLTLNKYQSKCVGDEFFWLLFSA